MLRKATVHHKLILKCSSFQHVSCLCYIDNYLFLAASKVYINSVHWKRNINDLRGVEYTEILEIVVSRRLFFCETIIRYRMN